MLKKILIANRGEIACRIARTAEKMGIATVAVYSDADAKALHVKVCDEAEHIGASPATESYLRIDKIIAAAKRTGADAIHPGYGFLSENPELPEACAKAGIIFIGPTAEAMRALGGKAAAKDIAIKAGVPVVPGYQGDKQDAKSLAKEAARVGYPVMIKAVAGGGGRGMRLVESEAHLPAFLESAQREAQSSFGNARVLIEKVVVRPRHIEVQVFGDTHGNVVHLFERDCTLQRRNQKVIEEAPAPGMTAGLRAQMCDAAVKLAKHVGYSGAGTVEFLVEGGALDETAKWYFIEMNTRLQVEHPVTEEITGLDLVEWQFRVAAGEALPLKQAEIKMSGHAIEVRLCAEDPAKGFMPSVGRIEMIEPHDAQSSRWESGVQAGDEISPFYDSMIVKIITKHKDRSAALQKASNFLRLTEFVGPQTNGRFIRRLLEHPDVISAKMDTGLIARDLDTLADSSVSMSAMSAGSESLLRRRVEELQEQADGSRRGESRTHSSGAQGGWHKTDAFQLGPQRRVCREIVVNGERRTAFETWGRRQPNLDERLDPIQMQIDLVAWDGLHDGPSASPLIQHGYLFENSWRVVDDWVQINFSLPAYDATEIGGDAATGSVKAPINGRVAKVFVTLGAKVAKGDKIAVVEAMKMEHIIAAAIDGTVDKLGAAEGAQVTQGTLIAHIEG